LKCQIASKRLLSAKLAVLKTVDEMAASVIDLFA
jgi:hypothetical protein